MARRVIRRECLWMAFRLDPPRRRREAIRWSVVQALPAPSECRHQRCPAPRRVPDRHRIPVVRQAWRRRSRLRRWRQFVAGFPASGAASGQRAFILATRTARIVTQWPAPGILSRHSTPRILPRQLTARILPRQLTARILPRQFAAGILPRHSAAGVRTGHRTTRIRSRKSRNPTGRGLDAARLSASAALGTRRSPWRHGRRIAGTARTGVAPGRLAGFASGHSRGSR